MNIRDDAAWSFETARLFIGLYIEPEEMDPADSFEFPEDVEAVRSGALDWFAASVRIYLKGEDDTYCADWREIGSDYLGGCAYTTVREFYTSHRDPDPMNRNCTAMRAVRGDRTAIAHYFPDMVRQAIDAARVTASRLARLAA